MFEVTVLFVVSLLVAAYIYLPSVRQFFSKLSQLAGAGTGKSSATTVNKLKLPEDSTLRRHFLTHLQSEIESALSPRPTDSILQRHYDALVTAELENRLAAFAD